MNTQLDGDYLGHNRNALKNVLQTRWQHRVKRLTKVWTLLMNRAVVLFVFDCLEVIFMFLAHL